MKKSLTFHNYNKSHRDHNVRTESCVKHMDHIDKDKMQYNIVLCDEKIKDAYNRIFGEAVKEYNERQQNPQRRIHNYYEHVKKSNKNLVYELVLAIGDKETTGSNYEDTKLERECLIEYFNTFHARNPHLECIGYYIHYDEATLHAHCCYLPVASGYKNGPKLQPGLNRALEMQGFKKKGKATPQIQWQDTERKAFKNICISKGIDIIDVASDRHKHMEKEEYIQYNKIKKNEKIITETNKHIEELKKELIKSKEVLKDLRGEVLSASEVKEMTLGTNILGKPNKAVKLTYKDYVDLKETAAYVDDIENIKNDEINTELERNRKLKFENAKLYTEKLHNEYELEQANENILMLERSLEDFMCKLDDLEEELQQEKLYTTSLETFMVNQKLGNNNLFELYLMEQEKHERANRQRRRSKKRNDPYDDYFR